MLSCLMVDFIGSTQKPNHQDWNKEIQFFPQIKFDGTHIHFSWGKEKERFSRFQKDASNLALLLFRQTKEHIPVYPLLILPDWNIKRSRRGQYEG